MRMANVFMYGTPLDKNVIEISMVVQKLQLHALLCPSYIDDHDLELLVSNEPIDPCSTVS